MRPRISAAALRVKVMARMFVGSTPRLSRLRYRSTSTWVLPVPADASSTTLCAGSTALARAAASGRSAIGDRPSSIGDDGRWTMDDGRSSSSNGSQLDIANVILPADGGVRAAGAHHCVGGRRRKFSTLDSVDRIEKTRLRVDEHGVFALAACQHRDELPILAKSDIAGLARFPVLSSGFPQVLHGTHGVHGQLQRKLAIGCTAQLVIDDAERMVLQQVDAIGLSTQRDAPGLGFCSNLKLPVERMLQQPLDDRRLPLGFHL